MRNIKIQPYEILQVERDASAAEVTRAYAKALREHPHKRSLLRESFDLLRQPEMRALVDAVIPDSGGVGDFNNELVQIEEELEKSGLPGSVFSEKVLAEQELRKLVEEIFRSFYRTLSPPESDVEISSCFDGLEEFISEWIQN